MQLGIDLGTSAVKLLVRNGNSIVPVSSPLSVQSPHNYWSEQDPEDWWQALLEGLRKLARDVPLAQISAIGLSGQMHGLVVLDDAHRVIRPAILWNDGRSFTQAAAMAKALPDVGTLAGVPPLPGFTAPKVLWMKEHEPAQYARIRHILLPKDYIGLRLHGALATDPSDAAGSLWLDQAARAWSDRLCAASATDVAWLPRLHDGSEVAGRVTPQAATQTGLPAGLPVVAGGGDAATGAVAMGATQEGGRFISLGTSGQVFVARDRHLPNPGKMVHAFAHCVPDHWFQMAAMLNGARPMSWFANVAQAGIPTLLQEAQVGDSGRTPLFLPYLTGERSPHGDPHIRGGFYGLEDQTARGDMMRAVVDSVAFCFADAFDSIGNDPASQPALAIGGGARSDYVLQRIADASGQHLERAAGADAGPAMGAAKLAAVAVGDLSLSDLSLRPDAEAHFTPRPDTTGLLDRLARYRQLYEALKPMREV
jgi:xylulokinase